MTNGLLNILLDAIPGTIAIQEGESEKVIELVDGYALVIWIEWRSVLSQPKTPIDIVDRYELVPIVWDVDLLDVFDDSIDLPESQKSQIKEHINLNGY